MGLTCERNQENTMIDGNDSDNCFPFVILTKSIFDRQSITFYYHNKYSNTIQFDTSKLR